VHLRWLGFRACDCAYLSQVIIFDVKTLHGKREREKMSNTSPTDDKPFFHNPQTLNILAFNMHIKWVLQHCCNPADYNTSTTERQSREETGYLSRVRSNLFWTKLFKDSRASRTRSKVLKHPVQRTLTLPGSCMEPSCSANLLVGILELPGLSCSQAPQHMALVQQM